LKNCKGFALAETIAAFSMWSIIVTILIPQLVLLTQERINTQQSTNAYKILYEKTQQVIFDEAPMVNEKIVHENATYMITWEEENDYTKACLHWTSLYKKEKTICFLVSE
jgi:competence protein ComGE